VGVGESRLSSIKINCEPVDTGAQVNGVISPGVLLTRSILSSNRVPGPPASGTKAAMKDDMRRVLILCPGSGVPVGVGVASGRMFAETFHCGSLVSPALWTIGVAKVHTPASKVKSPWKPTKLRPPVVVLSMSVVVTGAMITVEAGTELSMLTIGRDTTIFGRGGCPSIALGSGG